MRDSSSWTSDELHNPAVPPLLPRHPQSHFVAPSEKKPMLVPTQLERQGEFASLLNVQYWQMKKKAIKSKLTQQP